MNVRTALYVLACAPMLAAAQTPAKTEPPLPLKHIGLWGRSWFSLGGIQRFRIERDVNYLGGGPGTRTDAFGLSRTYLDADFHFSPSLRLYVEGRHSTARSRELPGGIRGSDRDEHDWSTVYIEKTRRMGDASASLRVGRQELTFGRERLVSVSDWSNVRRTFEGAALTSVSGPSTFSAFYAHPVVVRQTESNDVDQGVTFWGLHNTWKRENSQALIDLYYFDKSIDETAAAPRSTRRTLGGRVIAPFAKGWLAEVESAFQFGSMGDNSVRASMIASDLTRSWTVRWTPSLAVGADRASGTQAGHAALTGTFDALYALGHSFVGYADVLGRRNITEFRAVAIANPVSSVRLRASAHTFRRTSSDDAIYDTGGSVFRANVAGAPSGVGDEVDFTVQWRASKFIRLDAGGARFSPGAFMRATGAALDYTWAFASVTATY